MQRFDRYWIGILLGVLMPALFVLIYLNHYNLWFLLDLGKAAFPTYSKMCLLSVFPDMAFVFVFYSLNTWNISKGILIGSFPFMLASIAFTL